MSTLILIGCAAAGLGLVGAVAWAFGYVEERLRRRR